MTYSPPSLNAMVTVALQNIFTRLENKQTQSVEPDAIESEPMEAPPRQPTLLERIYPTAFDEVYTE